MTHEIFSFGEQIVVVPVDGSGSQNPAKKLAAGAARRINWTGARVHHVEMASDTAVQSSSMRAPSDHCRSRRLRCSQHGRRIRTENQSQRRIRDASWREKNRKQSPGMGRPDRALDGRALMGARWRRIEARKENAAVEALRASRRLHVCGFCR